MHPILSCHTKFLLTCEKNGLHFQILFCGIHAMTQALLFFTTNYKKAKKNVSGRGSHPAFKEHFPTAQLS
jgi:hypothetical protein